MTVPEETTTDIGPGEAEIRAQLERIRESPDFDVPERVRRFLVYIVEETLAGRGDRIKAYSIATAVFERNASFDAQNDPIVRIEARRLRLALERYYLTAGRDDAIGIAIPKGGYAPIFFYSTAAAEPAPTATTPVLDQSRPMARPLIGLAAAVAGLAIALGSWTILATERRAGPPAIPAAADAAVPDMPKLLVGGFEDLTGSESSKVLARGLTEEIVNQLARFREIAVVTDRGQGPADTSVPSPGNSPRYRLEGGLRTTPDRLRLTARLVDVAGGEVLWSDIYDETLDVREMMDLQSSLASDVVRALAQPYGIILRPQEPPLVPPADWPAYECTLAYYSYRVVLTPEAHASVQQCLLEATRRFPNYATAWALLSISYSDEMRYKYRLNADRSPPMPQAIAAAERAVDVDPTNVRGLEALMIAQYLSGRVDAALKTGSDGYEINPNDMEFVGEYGGRLAMSGDWDKGCALMTDARRASPAPAGYIEVTLAVCSYMAGDYDTAEAWIRTAPRSANPVYHFVVAAIAGQLGDAAAAATAHEWLSANAPRMLQDVRREVAMRIVQPADQAHFLDGLTKAGFLIPES